MPDDEKVVVNDATCYGLRRMHIIGTNQPIDLTRWLVCVPGEAIDDVSVYRFEEIAFHVHHLWLYWHAREPIVMIVAGQNIEGVLWYVKKGEKLTWSTDLAAMAYWLYFHTWPTNVYVKTLPQKATEKIDIYDEKGQTRKVIIKAEEWMPVRFVFVCKVDVSIQDKAIADDNNVEV